MEQSRNQTASVVKNATLAGTSLQTIANSVEQIDQMTTQIATAADEQSAVAGHMNGNVESVSEMAVKTSQIIEQSSQASEGLASIATELEQLVEQFHIAR